MFERAYQVEANEPEGNVNRPLIHGNLANPFPGLRPFDMSENHLFFGRENQVDEIMLKLAQNRFVSVLGYSGSGKSSLMFCGAIPLLYGGFMVENGPDWTVIHSRPGSAPIDNLAASILKAYDEDLDFDSEEFQLKRHVLKATLNSGGDGLVRALRQYKPDIQGNYFVLIDQFEELLRFRWESEDKAAIEESIAFVQLLLHAITQREVPVYVALTMRSDFVGDCSVFSGLTKLINRSNYLVPRMEHEQLRLVIKGPVAVGGGAISSRLVKLLMSEISDHQDQLPILQHALMRTWNYWRQNRDEQEPLDIRHYNAIGKMSGALSQHADEIFDEFDPREQRTIEVMFKALTERGQDSQGVRRAENLSRIAELSGMEIESVKEVVEGFRKPGRSFLMPSADIPLENNSIIEISHESLMRIWIRLRKWVDEENESAQMYMRLSEAAAMYQVGKTGLWRPPDLQLALTWQKKQKPTRAWAERYYEAFERAIVFLDTSRITYEAEQKNQEMLQKRLVKRARMVALGLGIAAVISIAFFIYGVIQQRAAEAQALTARLSAEEANQARIEAEISQNDAIEKTSEAEAARASMEEAYKLMQETNVKLESAVKNERMAKLIADRERQNAIQQSVIAKMEAVRADSARQEAMVSQSNYEKVFYLQTAQAMALKSLNIEDDDLKGAMAFQAFQFHTKWEGRVYDPSIYNGLYSSLAQIDGKTYNTVAVNKGSVRSVAFPNSSAYYFTTGSDGNVVKHNFDNPTQREIISSSKYRNKIVVVSKDDKYLVSGGDSTFVNVFNLAEPQQVPKRINVHQSYINDIIFLPDNSSIVSSSGDGTLVITDIITGRTKQLNGKGIEYKSLAVSSSGTYLLAGAENGKVTLYNLKDDSQKEIAQANGIPVYAVALSPNEQWIAYGNEHGEATLIHRNNQSILRKLIAHTSRVSDIEFSENGILMATSSLNGNIHLLVVNELDELPVVLSDNDSWVWDMDFSPDSQYLLAACEDGEIRVWATNPSIMAENMCRKIKRNMSSDEWETYVGDEIPYSETCADQLQER